MSNSPTPNWYTFKAVRNGGGVTSAIRNYDGTPANVTTENATTWAVGDKLRGEAHIVFTPPPGVSQEAAWAIPGAVKS